jgi:hypothetical protein
MNGQIVIWDLQDWKKVSSHLLSGGYSHAAALKKIIWKQRLSPRVKYQKERLLICKITAA